MPELPEVETVRRGLAPHLEAAAIVRAESRRPDLRFPLPCNFAARLAGRTVRKLGRRAKYLLADLDDGQVLVMHLGMSGSFRVGGEALPERPHDHVVFHLDSGKQVVFNDPRRFGMMDLVATDALPTYRYLAGLGIEPLDPDFDGARLAGLMQHKLAPLKAALLDQRLIAGLGNIYVCEALWRAGLSPRRAAGTLALKSGGPSARAHRLAAAIRAVIDEAIAVGGSSIRNHVGADGSIGAFQEDFAVYDRLGQPCRKPSCRGMVQRLVQSGRSTFYCPVCQR